MSDQQQPDQPDSPDSQQAGTDVEKEESSDRKVVSIRSLLKGLVKHKASDLHVKVGRPPLYRINGRLLPAKLPPLSTDEVKRLAYDTMTQKQVKEFEENLQIDFGYLVPGLARFRANVFMQKGTLAFVIRVVPLTVPVLESLGLPSIVQELCLKPRGLLLVTGATGSGKSTTMAAMIEHINRNSRSHIVTIEDPIEYIFEDRMSTISQREIGVDASSMAQALKGALRQDPDVIVIGEMRDFQTIQTAITAAETGHLVISTLHTSTASQSIDRILDSFPADGKNQLRLQLASSLLGVVTQRLVRRADGGGRVVACEILTRSPTVEKLIAENRILELESTMEDSNLYYKMQSMNQVLERLVREAMITQEEAVLHSDKQEDLLLKLSGMVAQSQGGVEASELLQQAQKEQRTGEVTDVGIGNRANASEGALGENLSSSASGIQVEGQEKPMPRKGKRGSGASPWKKQSA